MRHTCLLLMMLTRAFDTAAADEWRPVSPDESIKLRAIMEGALTTHWERCQRGWCRGTTLFLDDLQEFAIWWDRDRVGMEVTSIHPGVNRGSGTPLGQPHIALFVPNEHWVYKPAQQLCRGSGGVLARRLLEEFDVRPQRYWLSILGGASPKFNHRNLLQFLTSQGVQFRIVKNDSGLVAFDSGGGRLVLDSLRGFSPVLYENDTERDRQVDPERSSPHRETYELAQDRHGEWYCRKRVITSWPNGLDQPPSVFAPSEVLEYESRPTPEMLRLTFESLKLPDGTRVESTVRSRPGTWVVGREKEGQGAVTEERFRQLGKTMRTRGFAKETTP